MPVELWDRLLRVNLSSAFYVSREVVRHIGTQKGTVQRIINIGSVQGLITNSWGKISSYQSAKAGLVMFTKCLAAELGPDSTTVNCVAPGAILTESMVRSSRFANADADTEQFSKRIPLEAGYIEEVANVVVFSGIRECVPLHHRTDSLCRRRVKVSYGRLFESRGYPRVKIMQNEIVLDRLAWPEVEKYLQKDDRYSGLGSCEQHGRHLPFAVDVHDSLGNRDSCS